MTVATHKVRANGAAPAQAAAEFEAIFEAQYARVYGVLFRLVGDRADAEDLALETFWRLWQRPPERAGSLAGWLYRVALRLGYNALRARRRRESYEQQAGRDAFENNQPPDPALAVEQQAERERVRDALRQLPARDAQVLILRHSGFAYKEIAGALDVAPSSVGTLLARAEAEFERIFGGQDTPEPPRPRSRKE